jgi:hypothetical protein
MNGRLGCGQTDHGVNDYIFAVIPPFVAVGLFATTSDHHPR